MDSNNKKKISPAIFGIIIISFLLPFASISCNGQVIGSITGMQLATGSSIEGQKVEVEPLALLLLLVAIVGVVIYFWKNKKQLLVSSGLGIIGTIMALLLRSSMTEKVMQEGKGAFEINYGAGFYIILLGFLSAFGVNFYLMKENNAISNQENASSFEKYCPKCGTQNSSSALNCSSCNNSLSG